MSFRRTALLSTAALGLATLVPAFAGPAQAADPTCNGKTATLVLTNDNIDSYWDNDEYDFIVRGTAGDDVVVSQVTTTGGRPRHADIKVAGLGGDDTLCASRATPGPGEVLEGTRDLVSFILDGGTGSDTLVGSTGDEVFEYASDPTGGFDTITDPGGLDVLLQQVQVPGVPVITDAVQRTAKGTGVRLRWSGAVEAFHLQAGGRFVGSPAAETVELHGSDIRAATGGGDDRVFVVVGYRSDGSDVSLGSGNDQLTFKGDVVARGGRGNDTFSPWPGHDAPLVRAHLDGGPGTNRIRLQGVRHRALVRLDRGVARWGTNKAKIRRIGRVTGSDYADLLVGTSRHDVLIGAGGRDRLVGRGGKDLLLGGSGRDRAEGGAGRDRCIAEVRVSC